MYPGLSHAKRIEDAGVRLGVAVLARLRRRDGDDLAGAVLDDDVAALADLAGLHRDDLRRAGVGVLERLLGVSHVARLFVIDTPTGNLLERPVLGRRLENYFYQKNPISQPIPSCS